MQRKRGGRVFGCDDALLIAPSIFLSFFLRLAFRPTQSARRVASGLTASGSASARTAASATSRRGGAAAAPAGRESAAGEVEPS